MGSTHDDHDDAALRSFLHSLEGSQDAGWGDDRDEALPPTPRILQAILANNPHQVRLLAPHSDLLALTHYHAHDKLREEDRRAPLMLAVEMGHEACVDVLLEHNPQSQCAMTVGHGGRSVLSFAIEAGSMPCVQRLLPWCNDKARREGLITALVTPSLQFLQAIWPFVEPVGLIDQGDNLVDMVLNRTSNRQATTVAACVRFLLDQPEVVQASQGMHGDLSYLQDAGLSAIRNDHAPALLCLIPHLGSAGLTQALPTSWSVPTTWLHYAIEHGAWACFQALLPLSDNVLTLRHPAMGQRLTPLELAMKRCEDPDRDVDDPAQRMVDVLVARQRHLGLPTRMPTFVNDRGQPLTEAQRVHLWPATHRWLEEQTLRNVASNASPNTVRPRL